MAWHSAVKTSVRGPLSVGIIALVLAFGGFGAWASVAPLQGAVIAGGIVTPLGRNKLIQHLEGGIVREVLVAEGDSVVKDQPLILLDRTAPLALRNRIASQLATLSTAEARAVAERNGAAEIVFPPDLMLKMDDPAVAAAAEDQRGEFRARLDRYNAETDILDEQISALKEEIVGLQAQQSAVTQQLDLVLESKADLEDLLLENLVTKSRVTDLQVQEAQLTGQAGQIAALIAAARLEMAEKEHEKQRLLNARLEEASNALSDVRSRKSDLLEQLNTAQDGLMRTTVLSPDAGKVINLAQLGPGSVISPGQRIMDIVPMQAGLIVEAHIRPQDIDEVKVGQTARLAFAAFDQRVTPQVPGVIAYLAADRVVDERTGEPYYVARLEISGEPLSGFDPQLVGAGQPVDVFITTGERTFFEYLLEPIAYSATHALRE